MLILSVNDNTSLVSNENATILPSIASRGKTLLSLFGKNGGKRCLFVQREEQGCVELRQIKYTKCTE